MRPFSPTSSALLAALLVLACDLTSKGAAVSTSVETIIAGCGGGIAGIIEFVSVHRDGRADYRLMSARQAGPDSVSKARVDEWLESLEAARFFQHLPPQHEVYPDELSCSIRLVGPRHNHEIDVNREPRLDPKIRRVFDEVYGLIPRK